MAARNATVDLVKQTWTQLTAADATNIVFQNTGSYQIWVKATTDETTPTDQDDVLHFGPGDKEVTTIAALFPGLTGADRLWAYCFAGNGSVFVSHVA